MKGSSGGCGKAVGTTVSGLAIALVFLGKSSLCRVKMNLDVMGNEGLGSGLVSFSKRWNSSFS